MTKLIWVGLVLFILLFLLLLIIFTKLTISINYFHHNDDDDLKIEFKIWFGLIKYKKMIPLIKIDDDSPTIIVKSKSHMGDSGGENTAHNVTQIGKGDIITKLKNAQEMLQRVFHLNVIVRKFLKKVTVKQFEWHTFFGAGDAAHTGVLTGAIWGIKGGMVGFISHFLRFKVMPNLSVTPHFQATIIQTQIKCMIQFRIGHAILAGLKLVKFWKGGRPRFKSNSNFSKEKTKSV